MTDISIENLFIILFILLLLSAFLSGSETSLMSVNRYKLKHRFKLGEKSAEKVNFLITNPDKTLGLILLLNNFVNILASAISTLIAVQLYGQAGVAISVFALTVIILIFAEVTPKTFAALYPDKIAYPVSWIFYLLMKIFYPLVVIMVELKRIVDFYDTAMSILKLSKERYSLDIHRIRYEDDAPAEGLPKAK